MRRTGVHECAKQLLPASGIARFPFVEHRLDLSPLQSFLAAAEITGNDGILHRPGEFFAVVLRHMRKRAIDKQIAVLVDELGWHRRQPCSVKEVEHEGLENVVAVMAQNDGAAALLPRDPIQDSAAQPGTERTVGFSLWYFFRDYGIGILEFYSMRNPSPFEEFGQNGRGEAWLALVKIAGEEFHRQKPAPLQFMKHSQHGVAVLAARKT